MPPVIIAAFAYVGITVSVIAANVIFVVASYAIQTSMANRARKNAEDAQRSANDTQRASYNSGLVDRTTVVRTAVQPRNIILGRDEASGPLACWFTYGPKRNLHAFAIVLAGHECDAVEYVLFNHELVTLDANGGVTGPAKWVRSSSNTVTEVFAGGPPGTVVTLSQAPTRLDAVVDSFAMPAAYIQAGAVITLTNETRTVDDNTGAFNGGSVSVTYTVVKNDPLFIVKVYLGAPGQAAAPELINAAAAAGVPASWDATRRGNGICYLSVQVDADFNILGQIGIPNVSAIVRGVKALDPRTGLTAWTQNPAILARWFITDSGFSPQCASDEINNAELLASANVSEEQVRFGPGYKSLAINASGYGARYTANGQLTSAAAPMDNLNHILDAMDGDAVWISGQWQLVAGYYKTPTLTINEDTLSSAGITVVPRTAKRDLFNGVKGTFVNAYAGYVRSSYPLVTSTVYQAQDGGEMLPHDVNFELVNDPTRCQMIAWQRLTRARQPLTLQLGTTLKGYDGAPLQTVNVNLRRPGYVNKVFAILRREFDGNKLQYILQETGPAVWQWDYTKANQAVDLPNTSFPVLGALPILQNVSTSSGTADLLRLGDGTIVSRVRVRWDTVKDIYVTNGGKIEWQHKVANVAGDVWQSLPLADGTDVEIFTGALKDGQLLLLRGRCVSSLGRRGDWCPLVSLTVIGKTEPPPSVKTFAIQGPLLSWSPVVAIDLAGYQVRFNYGQNTDWGTGTPLQTGLITASPWLPDILPPGKITLMIKAVDTSGNQSALAASILVNLGDVIVANLILTYDDKAAGFPGSQTGSAVVAGNLLANDSGGLFWGADNASFWTGGDTGLFWPTATYLELSYSTAYAVTPLQAGVRLTLLSSIVGASYTIEYRYDTSGLFWGADNDFAWGADAALYWPAPTAWRTWPGAIDNIAEGRIEFRVVIQAGEVQGAINTLTLQFDVIDEFEQINNVAVSALGTRLALVKKYRSVNNVQLTLQADGGSAINARTVDKLATGPLVICVNSAGAQVAGILDARVQGVKG